MDDYIKEMTLTHLVPPDVENALRVGDVYALMVEWFYSQRQMEQAHNLITKMVARSIVLAPYLDGEMVAAICATMGVAVPQVSRRHRRTCKRREKDPES